MPNVIVIGAGISGLAVAYRLRQAGLETIVLEAADQAGGNIRTIGEHGFLWERGPNGFLDSNPSTFQLAQELDLGNELVAASEGAQKNRYLSLNEKLVKLPTSLCGLLTTKAMSIHGKLSLAMEPFRQTQIREEESVYDFAVRRFGIEAADTVVDALVTGIHGGDPKQLSLAAAFPKLARFEVEYGSVVRGFRKTGHERSGPSRLWSFYGGMQTLIDTLVAALGDNLKLRCSAKKIDYSGGKWTVKAEGHTPWLADAVVVTAPAPVQAQLLGNLDPGFVSELNAITYNHIVVVALGYRDCDAPQFDGFGYITPQNTRRDVLGVQWCSSIFPGRAPPGHVLWRALLGGVRRSDLVERSDEALIGMVQDEMKTILDVTGAPVFSRVVRRPRAIPQYVLGHRARVDRLKSLASLFPGLFLGGNSYHGIAVNDCTEQALRITSRVVSYLSNG